MPYVSPEQMMKDRADFARKGISRGKSVVAIEFDRGVLFVAENPSTTLHKISEIYDRVAFAAVGKYNEFELLRRQGIRLADITGYQYAREDVTGRSLANAYANSLGSAFTEPSKPFEVELLVAEVTPDAVDLYHILYDGSISDESGHVVIGGTTEPVNRQLADRYAPGMDLGAALRAAHAALSSGEDRAVDPRRLEVAGLDRDRGRRKFFRLETERVVELLDTGDGTGSADESGQGAS
ncbi:proteasome subunit alpha [Egibacter rhizosphaerae]|uniref:Proteasome subunit alpha n=2 Tax=Egibacter rhizosphaerae TaxID=1670831 RepID=A0A411YLQ8_9ACTN|nr:proteasome subunit alpha [Egibacter rhizosphaerae]